MKCLIGSTCRLAALVATLSIVTGAQAAALHDGLIGYWKLDEGSGGTANDTAPAGSVSDTGTEAPANSLTWINGKFNAGIDFTGSQLVRLPSSTDLDIGTSAVSVSAWVKLDVLPSDAAASFAGILDSEQDNYVMYLDRGNQELRFKVTNSAGTSTVAHPGIKQSQLNTTDWLHVLGVYDGAAGSVKIYLNGNLADIGTIGSAVTTVRTGQVAGIGGQPESVAPVAPDGFYFDGGISDVAVWNRALSSTEAQYLYNGGTGNAVGASNPTIAPPAPLAPIAPVAQPVICYSFDGDLKNYGTGGAAYDAILVDEDATGPQFTPTAHGLGLDLSHNPQDVNSTATNGDYLKVDYVLPEQGTIEVRFSSEVSYDFQTIWSSSGHNNAWEAWVYGNERLAARLNNSANAGDTDFMLPLIGGIEEEHHIAYTWVKDGTTVETKLYVDGVLREIGNGTWLAPAATFFLGGGIAANGANELSKGVFDEFKIYDVALNANEVLFNSQIPEPSSIALVSLAAIAASAWGIRRRVA